MKTDLSTYDNSWFKPGSSIKRVFWYFVNELFVRNPLIPSSSFKVFLLRLFGAKIGNKVVVKPKVNIKYPWKLRIGNHCWIGESVWIDNLAEVTIEDLRLIHEYISKDSEFYVGRFVEKIITRVNRKFAKFAELKTLSTSCQLSVNSVNFVNFPNRLLRKVIFLYQEK